MSAVVMSFARRARDLMPGWLLHRLWRTVVIGRLAFVSLTLRVVPRLPRRADDLLTAVSARLTIETPKLRAELKRQHVAFPSRSDHRDLLLSRIAVVVDDRCALARLGTARGVSDPPYRHVAGPATMSLIESDRTIVVASGHFASRLLYPLARGALGARAPTIVLASSIDESQPPFERWLRGTIERRRAAGLRSLGLTLVERGDGAAFRSAIRALEGRGQALGIFADADQLEFGVSRGHKRPFLARADGLYGFGVARIARMAQAPIVVCIPRLDASGTIVYEWSDPIEPPARGNRGNEVDITDAVLDELERGIGRYPDRYGARIGRTRSWDALEQRWFEIG